MGEMMGQKDSVMAGLKDVDEGESSAELKGLGRETRACLRVCCLILPVQQSAPLPSLWGIGEEQYGEENSSAAERRLEVRRNRDELLH